MIGDNVAVMDELFNVHAQPVKSDFELQIQKEINTWIKKQPAHKSWATPADSAAEFWAEKLS
jgi:hypothetical protein